MGSVVGVIVGNRERDWQKIKGGGDDRMVSVLGHVAFSAVLLVGLAAAVVALVFSLM